MIKLNVNLLMLDFQLFSFEIIYVLIILSFFEGGKLSDGVSEAGIKYYLNLIKYLKRKGLVFNISLYISYN